MRYRMDDNTVLDSENASQSWQAGDTWLHRSRRGRYWLEHTASLPVARAEWVGHHRACAWLLEHSLEVPEELKEYADEIIE